MLRSETLKEFWALGTPEQQSAMAELELRGLSFCSHFGYENAIEILADMDRAVALGVLYEWMRRRMGILTS